MKYLQLVLLEAQERDFSDSSGIIPDVVEMRSHSGPPFIALVRYKIAKLTQETVPAKARCFLFFPPPNEKLLSIWSLVVADHRPSSFAGTAVLP